MDEELEAAAYLDALEFFDDVGVIELLEDIDSLFTGRELKLDTTVTPGEHEYDLVRATGGTDTT